MSLTSDIKRHVKSHCATFNTATDSDCLRDTTCVYFQEGGGRCAWFENCVLPSDESLTARYWNALGNTDAAADYCEGCSLPYEKKSNAQRFCSKCREDNEREKRRKRDREYRERKRRIQAEIS
jgi:hypothetical protein